MFTRWPFSFDVTLRLGSFSHFNMVNGETVDECVDEFARIPKKIEKLDRINNVEGKCSDTGNTVFQKGHCCLFVCWSIEKQWNDSDSSDSLPVCQSQEENGHGVNTVYWYKRINQKISTVRRCLTNRCLTNFEKSCRVYEIKISNNGNFIVFQLYKFTFYSCT